MEATLLKLFDADFVSGNISIKDYNIRNIPAVTKKTDKKGHIFKKWLLNLHLHKFS